MYGQGFQTICIVGFYDLFHWWLVYLFSCKKNPNMQWQRKKAALSIKRTVSVHVILVTSLLFHLANRQLSAFHFSLKTTYGSPNFSPIVVSQYSQVLLASDITPVTRSHTWDIQARQHSCHFVFSSPLGESLGRPASSRMCKNYSRGQRVGWKGQRDLSCGDTIQGGSTLGKNCLHALTKLWLVNAAYDGCGTVAGYVSSFKCLLCYEQGKFPCFIRNKESHMFSRFPSMFFCFPTGIPGFDRN